MTRLCYLYTNYRTSRNMKQELKVLGKFMYSHFLCFFDSKADLMTSVTKCPRKSLGIPRKGCKKFTFPYKTTQRPQTLLRFFPLTSFDSAVGRAWSFCTGKLFSLVPHPLARAVNKPSPCGFFFILVNRRFVNRLLWQDNTWALPVCPVPRCSRSFIWGYLIK